MGLSTVVELSSPFSNPRVIDLKVRSDFTVPAGTVASELMIIELPALTRDQLDRRLNSGELPGGKAYSIDLAFFSVNCLSADYDARLFSRDDITASDTLWKI